MHNNAVMKDESLMQTELSENNLLAFNPLFMEYSLDKYITKPVNKLPSRRKKILRTK